MMKEVKGDSKQLGPGAKKTGSWLHKLGKRLNNSVILRKENTAIASNPSGAAVEKNSSKAGSIPPYLAQPSTKKPGFLKRKFTAFIDLIVKLAEPLYWAASKRFGIKYGSMVYKIIDLVREQYVIIVTVIVGYFLARGVFIYPARHIVIYSAIPVFLIIAFAKPLLALIMYLVFTLGMLNEVVWNFPRLRTGSPLLLLAIGGWLLSTLKKERGERIQFVPDFNNFSILGLWIVAALNLLGYGLMYPSITLINWLLLFFVCTHLIGKNKQRLFYMINTFGGIYAFYVYKVLRKLAYYGFDTTLAITAEVRGRMADNNELAAALNAALPIFYALFLWERRKWLKSFWLAIFVMGIAAILATSSRGGYITLVVVFLLVFFRIILANKKKVVSIVMLIVLIMGTYSIYYERVNMRIQDTMNWATDPSAHNRILSLVTGWKMLEAHPWKGIGIGKAWYKFTEYCPPTFVVPTGWGKDDYVTIIRPRQTLELHNAYGQIAGEAGIPGITLFLLILFGPLFRLHHLRKVLPRTEENEWVFPLSIALEIAIIAFIVNSMFLSTARAGNLYVLVAYATSLYYIAMGQNKPRVRKTETIVVATIVLLFGYWLFRTIIYRM